MLKTFHNGRVSGAAGVEPVGDDTRVGDFDYPGAGGGV